MIKKLVLLTYCKQLLKLVLLYINNKFLSFGLPFLFICGRLFTLLPLCLSNGITAVAHNVFELSKDLNLFVNINLIKNETLNRIWNLKNVSDGLLGVDIDYKNGIVTWEFILENQSLVVTSSLINNGTQSAFLPLKGGNSF